MFHRLRVSILACCAGAALASGVWAGGTPTTRIFAWGDSMTYGYYDGTNAGNDCSNGHPDNNAPEVCGYPGRLGSRLNDLTKFAPIYDVGFLNLGKGGEQATSALSRMDRDEWTCPCHELDKPCRTDTLKYWYCNGVMQAEDLLVLWEGTNDITNQVSGESISHALENLGLKAEGLGLNVVIAKVVQRHPEAGLKSGTTFSCSNNGATRVTNLNLDIDDLATTHGWPEVNTFGRFNSGDVSAGLYANYYQGWDVMVCSDECEGLCLPNDPVGHPNVYGFDALACSGTKTTACSTSNSNYSKTFEYTVRSALPPRLTLTAPSSPQPTGVSLGFSVALPDIALFDQTISLTWDFGDGTVIEESVTSSPAAKNHTYTLSGPRTVTITAEQENGSHRQATAQLQINPGSTIFVDGFESGNMSNWIVGS